MEEGTLGRTSKFTEKVLKDRVKQKGVSDELQKKIAAGREDEGEVESPFSSGIEYLTEHFSRQSESLRALKGLNDNDERRRKSLPVLLRRKEMLNSLDAALSTESFTDLERKQLRWFFDIGCAFANQISKELGIFGTQYGVSAKESSIESNVTTAEMQQNLAQLVITNARLAGTSSTLKEAQEGTRHLEEAAFSLLNTMAVNAMGMSVGTALHTAVKNGVYGTAAAYFIYNDPRLNKFKKSFRVIFPSPYVDAIDGTDLVLIDEEHIPEQTRAEIMKALQIYSEEGNGALDKLSKEAKGYIYKVQVKSRSNGTESLSANDIAERDRFISARCKARGFDNYDYLILNGARARGIIDQIRHPAKGSQA